MTDHLSPEEKTIHPALPIRGYIFAALIVAISVALGVSHDKYVQSDEPMIRLGNETITTRQFQYYVRLQRQELINWYYLIDKYKGSDYFIALDDLSSQLSEDNATKLGQGVINSLTNNLLIRQEAQVRGIQVSDAEIQGDIQSGFNRCAGGALTREITQIDLLFPKHWSANPSPPPGSPNTFDQIMAQCAKLGVTEKDYYYIVTTNLLYEKLYDVITADIQPFQEQVWARHIMVKERATALDILERIENGEDFGALAAEFSIDTATKDQGGDLGWFEKGVMVPEFEAAAFSTEVGQISVPIQTQFGWHLIQVIGYEEHRQVSAERFEQMKLIAFSDWLAGARVAAEQTGLLTIFDYWKDRIPLDPALPEPTSQSPQ
jgi:parvulin-like peptidyl-prolyl isomerase